MNQEALSKNSRYFFQAWDLKNIHKKLIRIARLLWRDLSE
jgi:hypothetical protein